MFIQVLGNFSNRAKKDERCLAQNDQDWDSPVLGLVIWSKRPGRRPYRTLSRKEPGMLAKIYRTVWCARRQATLPRTNSRCAFNGGHVAATSAGPMVGRPHQTVRCAQRPKAPTTDSMVGSTGYWRGSLTVHCPVCTEHSSAPRNRRQQRPSKWGLNDSLVPWRYKRTP
jgi:hypothetical protein